jgi:tetratricopeptide (TPR) repeat protein
MIPHKLIFWLALSGMVILPGLAFTASTADIKKRDAAGISAEDADREWGKQSTALKDKGAWNSLKTLAEDQLKTRPNSFAAWNDLGEACGNLKEFDCAIRAYRQAVAIRPGSEASWEHLGEAYRKTGELDDALKAYQKALGRNKNSAENWNRLGFVHHELQQYQPAIRAYRTALRINPEYAPAWLNLGIAYNNLKQYGKAVVAFNEATRSNGMGAVWSHVGYSYLALKRYPEAIKAYEEAVRMNPNDTDAWYNLGVVYAYLGRRDMIKRVHSAIQKLDLDLAESFFQRFVLP